MRMPMNRKKKAESKAKAFEGSDGTVREDEIIGGALRNNKGGRAKSFMRRLSLGVDTTGDGKADLYGNLKCGQ